NQRWDGVFRQRKRASALNPNSFRALVRPTDARNAACCGHIDRRMVHGQSNICYGERIWTHVDSDGDNQTLKKVQPDRLRESSIASRSSRWWCVYSTRWHSPPCLCSSVLQGSPSFFPSRQLLPSFPLCHLCPALCGSSERSLSNRPNGTAEIRPPRCGS